MRLASKFAKALGGFLLIKNKVKAGFQYTASVIPIQDIEFADQPMKKLKQRAVDSLN